MSWFFNMCDSNMHLERIKIDFNQLVFCQLKLQLEGTSALIAHTKEANFITLVHGESKQIIN
jgi:hypothetical protein